MNQEPPIAYEQLTPEEAAHIDAVCDRFERAWKEARTGGPAPRLASYTGIGHGSAREVLVRELVALDRACRERYGFTLRFEDSGEPGAGIEALVVPETRPLCRHASVPTARPEGWPRIPGLEMLAVLGSGGMGVVFKARQETLDRDVAVKFLRDDHRTDPGRRERFLQEARAVARLRHPHLVQVYEFGELPAASGTMSQPYLVLEYVSGGSLADLLRGTPQPPREAARLVETLADAIHYAHQQGVIHRDLKPSNVLLQRTEVTAAAETAVVSGPRPLTADLCAKVTDFGLAKLLAGSDLTHSGEVLGTPCYMAPEQATGKSELLTAAVDVYGLGAILYEALTGCAPFEAAKFDTMLGLVRQNEPVPPRRVQPTVPRDLETICLKCLRKEPDRRYATAQDLADDLRRFRAGEPIQARPVGTGERVVVWCRRNPIVAGLLAALMLVFLAGSAGVLWQWHRAASNAAEAQKNADAYLRERDIARYQKERAERHLQTIRERVERLDRLGRDLLQRPKHYRAGKAVLEEALAVFQELLPEQGNDPQVRREAAQLFGRVAAINQTLGLASKAAEDYGRQAVLLNSLLEEEPASKPLRIELADSHRWRGNALRDSGNVREAQEAYDQAASLHKQLLREFPDDASYRVALANTLLNMTSLLSHRDHAEELEPLYRRIVELNQSAVDAAPDSPGFKAELALVLGDQGMFFLDVGRGADAEDALREAAEIHQGLLGGGHLKGYIEHYAARNLVRLGQVLAAAGQVRKAEQSYLKAVNLLDPFWAELPESAVRRASLAKALASLADLLRDTGRQRESEEIRRRVVWHFENLKADFPDDPQHWRLLAHNYLQEGSLLWGLGQQADAAELYRKALELAPEDPDVNNELAWFLATNPEPCLRDAALAVQLATKAVNAREKSGECRNTLGVAHYRNGDDKAAITELETSMRLRAGGDSFDWFFLALSHWRLGDRDKARMWFDRAAQWMDKYMPYNDELRRFRAEADMLTDPSEY
jgi:tetratricopeptide (TPR) repeat protein